ncbi:hypothetical protein [Methylomonas sp. MK1]|uniref:hypothetical protein n=1 Tax=Methylomonas sp. MK1 TaxID=1131552 RepID=UPI0003680A68|nr:hypothetical protein [Methylomonas sp. MK1]
MNYRVLSFIALLTAFPLVCFAKKPLAEVEITSRVVQSAKKYIDSIACDAVTTTKHVAALSPFKTVEDQDSAKYAVLWSGDIGCLGGSGSIQNYVALVTISPNGRFLVDSTKSSPAVQFGGFPSRNFPKLVGNTDNSIVLEGLDDDPEGIEGKCCPSLPVRVTVSIDANGNWVIVDRKVLPRNVNANRIPRR